MPRVGGRGGARAGRAPGERDLAADRRPATCGAIRLDESFLPDHVAPESIDATVAIDEISGGEREQVHLAVRLALADVLFDDQRQLVVLDDVLTATDPARFARVLPILEEAAERFQILILTCHPERYRGLSEAKFVDLEEKGERPAMRLRNVFSSTGLARRWPRRWTILVERFGSGGSLDLGGVIVALPGGRSSRRLLELLVERAEAGGRALVPPRIVTVGKLPELLYTAKRPFAGDLVQQLAWVEALRSAKPERLAALLPSLPEADDLATWLALGEMLGRLHRELAAEAMDFQSVVDCGGRIDGFREAAAMAGAGRDPDGVPADARRAGAVGPANRPAVRHPPRRVPDRRRRSSWSARST